MSGPARNRPGDGLRQPPGGPPAAHGDPSGHPEPEQLAAYVAGEDLDTAAAGEVAEHVSACPACAADVDALHALGAELDALEEPELPAGLHERIVAAVAAETGAGASGTSPEQDASVRPFPAPAERAARRARRRNRILGLAAVAAAVLVSVALVGWPGVLMPTTGSDSVTSGGPGDASVDDSGEEPATNAAPEPMVAESAPAPAEDGAAAGDAPAGQVPEYTAAGEYGADDVPDTLDDPDARAAYDAATADDGADESAADADAGDADAGGEPAEEEGGEAEPEVLEAPAEEDQAADENADAPQRDVTKDSAPETDAPQESAEEDETVAEPTPPTTVPAAQHQRCLDRVAEDGRQPVYVVEAEREGEPAIVVAAAERGQTDVVWLYTFLGDCAAEPIVERTPVDR